MLVHAAAGFGEIQRDGHRQQTDKANGDPAPAAERRRQRGRHGKHRAADDLIDANRRQVPLRELAAELGLRRGHKRSRLRPEAWRSCVGIEKRRLHDRRAHAMANDVNRVLDLDLRSRIGAKVASTVARPIICFRTGDHVDDVMRPICAAGANTGTAARDAVATASGGSPTAEYSALDIRPVDGDADDATRGAGAALVSQRAPADERRLDQIDQAIETHLERRVPLRLGQRPVAR